MSQSLHESNDASFEADVLQSDIPVLVDFWATWCGPCKAMVPHLVKLSDELGDKMKIVKINVEQNATTATKYKVLKLPTLLVFKGGEIAEKVIGNPGPRKLRELCEKHI